MGGQGVRAVRNEQTAARVNMRYGRLGANSYSFVNRPVLITPSLLIAYR